MAMASTLAPRRHMSGPSAIVGAGSEPDLAGFRTKDADSSMLAAVGGDWHGEPWTELPAAIRTYR
jgi:hypothetical protein